MKAVQEDRLDKARTLMVAAEAAAPADANAHRELSHGFYKLGDEPRALDHLERTLVLQAKQATGDDPRRQVGSAAVDGDRPGPTSGWAGPRLPSGSSVGRCCLAGPICPMHTMFSV